LDKEKEEKVRKVEEERDDLSRELRYTQQVVAGELAGWQEWRAKAARRAIRDLARNMVIQERSRLDGMRRAIRRLRADDLETLPAPRAVDIFENVGAVVPDLEATGIVEPINTELEEEAEEIPEVQSVDEVVPPVVETDVEIPASALVIAAAGNTYDPDDLD
jgi:hypothetical protein